MSNMTMNALKWVAPLTLVGLIAVFAYCWWTKDDPPLEVIAMVFTGIVVPAIIDISMEFWGSIL